jgi:hypothetical protein
MKLEDIQLWDLIYFRIQWGGLTPRLFSGRVLNKGNGRLILSMKSKADNMPDDFCLILSQFHTPIKRVDGSLLYVSKKLKKPEKETV